MTSIEKLADSYRAILIEDRDLRPVTIALIVIVAVWLAAYFISCVTDQLKAQTGGQLDSSYSVMSLVGP